MSYETNHVRQRGITMIVTFIITGFIVAVVCVDTVIVVRSDSRGQRPYCEGYDSRFPQ